MAAHALQVYDIAIDIVNRVVRGKRGAPAQIEAERRIPAGYCRVNRTFNAIAVERLWREVDALEHLFKTISTVTWEQQGARIKYVCGHPHDLMSLRCISHDLSTGCFRRSTFFGQLWNAYWRFPSKSDELCIAVRHGVKRLRSASRRAARHT